MLVQRPGGGLPWHPETDRKLRGPGVRLRVEEPASPALSCGAQGSHGVAFVPESRSRWDDRCPLQCVKPTPAPR